jgi:hypothetical protein
MEKKPVQHDDGHVDGTYAIHLHPSPRHGLLSQLAV